MTHALALTLVAFLAPIAWPVSLSATDTHTCFEDQVAVWDAHTRAHTRCLDLDDPRTQEVLTR